MLTTNAMPSAPPVPEIFRANDAFHEKCVSRGYGDHSADATFV